jgi:hypothetical protein
VGLAVGPASITSAGGLRYLARPRMIESDALASSKGSKKQCQANFPINATPSLTARRYLHHVAWCISVLAQMVFASPLPRRLSFRRGFWPIRTPAPFRARCSRMHFLQPIVAILEFRQIGEQGNSAHGSGSILASGPRQELSKNFSKSFYFPRRFLPLNCK